MPSLYLLCGRSILSYEVLYILDIRSSITFEEEKIEELNGNVHKEKAKTRQVSNGCKTLEDRTEVPDHGLTVDERKKTKQEASNGCNTSEDGVEELTDVFQKPRGKRNRKEGAVPTPLRQSKRNKV